MKKFPENTLEDFTETLISSEQIYEGSIIKLRLDEVKLPNGNIGKREVIMHSGGVVIVPYTTDGQLVLVEQYRHSLGQKLLEFPAGRLNQAGKEDPMEAALRELREETGYTAKQIKPLGHIFTAPGFCDERLYMYLATDLTAGEQETDEDEFVNVIHLSKADFAKKVQNCEIEDAKTLAAWGLIAGII